MGHFFQHCLDALHSHILFPDLQKGAHKYDKTHVAADEINLGENFYHYCWDASVATEPVFWPQNTFEDLTRDMWDASRLLITLATWHKIPLKI